MNNSWEKLSEERIPSGYRKILRRRFRLPDGKEDDYDVIQGGPVVCIVPLTEDNKVVLIELYRPGPEALLKELPGGFIEPTEDPMTAAARELLEETGYEGELEYVGTAYDDAYSTLVRHNFVAHHCRKVAEPQGDEDEFGEIVLMTVEEFRKHLRSGALTDIETGYLGLDHLGLL